MPTQTPLRPLAALIVLGLIAAGSVQAQSTGGGGRGHGGRKGGSSSPPATSSPADSAAPTRATPLNEVEITGVVRQIGPEADRVTIAYDAVDALSWPAGTMPFTASKSALLKGVTVGEKIRFKLDSQQISALRPF